MNPSNHAKTKKKRRIPVWKVVLLVVLTLVILLAAAVTVIILRAPDLDKVSAAPKGYRTEVLDDSENTVRTLSGADSNREYVNMDAIPENLQHAFVAVEDSRFYKHHGVDLYGIGRAVVRNIAAGRISEGASTITQQLVKNNVLTGWTDEKTFLQKAERKIQEMYLALRLERIRSKKWILENYLNTVNLGSGNWGVQTASKYYFNKDVSDLSLSECAVLAGIVKSPTRYDPLVHPQENAARRKIVLKDMRDQDYITREQYDEAMADNVYDRISAGGGYRSESEMTTYFEDAMVKEVVEDLSEQTEYSEDEAWNLIYSGGLKIYSTENSRLQALVDQTSSDDGLYGVQGTQSSMVLIDNETGEVKAMNGGRGPKTASMVMNRATDAKRQPGSTIKIIGQYAAALDAQTVTLGTTFDDAPDSYTGGKEVRNAGGTYGGETTVRDAIRESCNVVALKCFKKAGLESVWAQLKNFGITTLGDSDRNEALALGGTDSGVTNLQMTSAYSAIARGGEYREPVYYSKVLDREGNVLLQKEQDTHTAVNSDTAALLTSAMESVVTDGTGKNAAVNGVRVAGKSGTSTGSRDVWFIGFSDKYTLGVWGGYDDSSEQQSGSYVQKLWRTVMQGAGGGSGELADTDGLVKCSICTKCGRLAVAGLCDNTLQGNMTREEYYAEGTAPDKECTCHVKEQVCTVSGQKAGKYCLSTETRVYLRKGTAGTADAEYALPDGFDNQTCTVHTHLWNVLDSDDSDADSRNSTGRGSTAEDDSGDDDEEDSGGWDLFG